MITAKEIRHALRKLVEENVGLPYEVSFNRIEKSSKSYVWIDLRMTKKNIDGAYFDWNIGVDIQVILHPDDYAAISYDDLWDIADKFTSAIMPCLKIETEDGLEENTRYVTIQNFNAYVVDDVLHYEFNLDFTDYVQSDKYEGKDYDVMENLELDLDRGSIHD